ncbi:MAG: FAD-dependent oxidoreductase [Vampirovibrionales bacterium]
MNAKVIIIGDELEACVTACVLGWHGVHVTILRRSTSLLGGLSTRGGLSYMDLTPDFIPPMMQSMLNDAGLKRVALHAETADAVLKKQLSQANVNIVSGIESLSPLLEEGASITGIQDAHSKITYTADFYIDATPDATIARQAGVPSMLGLQGVFGDDDAVNALGVSPVFRVAGLDYRYLQTAEEGLRHRADMPNLLARHMPWLSEDERHALIERPTYAPEESDYLDILNNVIGVAYHHWRYGENIAYESAPFWVDGFNIARLSDGSLGFNGLITRMPLAEQVKASEEGHPPTSEMMAEMLAFVDFLKEITQVDDLHLLPPEEIYIRQTYLLEAQENITGRDLFLGGVDASESVGTFSYWLDFRGVHPWKAYPDLHPLPKPVFNVGLKPHFPKQIDNLAFVGRSSGFSPLSQGACRIVQYGCIVGEALAHALAIAFQRGIHPLAVEPSAVYEAQAQLAVALNVANPQRSAGVSTITQALTHSTLLARDESLGF